MFDKISEVRKAVAAFLVPALIALAAALADGVVTPEEWVHIAIAALGTAGVVYAVRNEKAGE